tara:strand:+ start:16 stop:174 length:159 start_codon:yes stop_codon:yes gene_type:complete
LVLVEEAWANNFGHPLDVSWKRGGRLKKWIIFLVVIIHVRQKSPVNKRGFKI